MGREEFKKEQKQAFEAMLNKEHKSEDSAYYLAYFMDKAMQKGEIGRDIYEYA